MLNSRRFVTTVSSAISAISRKNIRSYTSVLRHRADLQQTVIICPVHHKIFAQSTNPASNVSPKGFSIARNIHLWNSTKIQGHQHLHILPQYLSFARQQYASIPSPHLDSITAERRELKRRKTLEEIQNTARINEILRPLERSDVVKTVDDIKEGLNKAFDVIREMDMKEINVNKESYLKILRLCAMYELGDIAHDIHNYILSISPLTPSQTATMMPTSATLSAKRRGQLLQLPKPKSSPVDEMREEIEQTHAEELAQHKPKQMNFPSQNLMETEGPIKLVAREDADQEKSEEEEDEDDNYDDDADDADEKQQKKKKNNATTATETTTTTTPTTATTAPLPKLAIHRTKRVKIAMDLELYNALLNVFAECCDKKRTMELLLEMQNNHFPIDVDTYNSLIKLAAKMGDHENALRIVTQMKQNGVQPNGDTEIILMDYL